MDSSNIAYTNDIQNENHSYETRRSHFFSSIRNLKIVLICIYASILFLLTAINSSDTRDFIIYTPYTLIFLFAAYIFRGFEENRSNNIYHLLLSFCVSAFLGLVVLGAILGFIEQPFEKWKVLILLIFSVVFFPLVHYFIFNIIMRKILPTRRFLVFGNKKIWEKLISEIIGLSPRRMVIIDFLESKEELIDKINTLDLDSVDFALDTGMFFQLKSDPQLKEYSKVYRFVESIPVMSISTMVENHMKVLPIQIVKKYEQHYELLFSEINISFMSRVLDVIASITLIFLFLPILSISMLLILIMDGGPVFFTQKRHGYKGKLFNIYKLRTYKVTDQGLVSLRSGSILRKLRFNEIPQILNIFNGDMSLVGPRPDVPDTFNYCRREIPYYHYRTYVKPGITGHAQVNFKYLESLDVETFTKRLEYDLYYVKNSSVYLYITTLLRTVESIVFLRGA